MLNLLKNGLITLRLIWVATAISGLALVWTVPAGYGQVAIPVTNSLASEGGREFFMHTVGPGQTYFSIARTYRVTLDQLRSENPQSGNVLETGTVLRIPVTSQNSDLRLGTAAAQTLPSASAPPAAGQTAPTPSPGTSPATGQTAPAASPGTSPAAGQTAPAAPPGTPPPSPVASSVFAGASANQVFQDRSRRRTDPNSRIIEGEMTYLEAMNLEQELHQSITRALNHHFDPRSYLLFLQVEFSTRYYEEQIPVPVMQSAPEQSAVSEQLPGLPFVPPAIRRSLAPAEPTAREIFETREVRVPEIDRFDIVLWADSLYSEPQLDLMQQVVLATVSLDFNRGDRLQVLQRSFGLPDETDFFVADTGPDYYFYLLLAGILLFAFFLALFAWLIWTAPSRTRQLPIGEMPSLSLDPPSLHFDYHDEGARTLMLESNGRDKQTALSSREFLMQVVLHHPEQIGRLFTYWHENEGEHALMQAATILQSVDPKLLGMLKHAMSDQVYQKLEGLMRDPLIQSPQKREEILSRFADQLRLRQQQSGNQENFALLPTFDFLHYTPDEKLMDLLKNENERVKALVISHLPGHRRSALLEDLSLEQAGRILFCLPQVRNMPYHEYERIASRLFDRSYYLEDIGAHITEKDVEQIVSIIESLPVSDQEKYIGQLDEQVSDLADAVRRRVITMERLYELGDDMLEEAVDAMTREDLAIALAGTGEELRTRILRFRPRREEALIREQMEDEVFLSREEIDGARALLLNKLREIRNRERAKERRRLMASTERIGPESGREKADGP